VWREESRPQEKFSLQIRWFDRLQNCAGTESKELEILDETDDVCEEPIDSSCLLGPVALMNRDPAATVWKAYPAFLPVAPFLARTSPSKDDAVTTIGGMIERGINLASCFSTDYKRQVLRELREEAMDLIGKEAIYQLPLQLMTGEASEEVSLSSPTSKSDNLLHEARVRAPNPPFHVSATDEFYDKVCVVPRFEAFSESLRLKISKDEVWEVNLGDIFAVQCDVGPKEPLCVPWGVAEVVAIYRTNDQESDSETSTTGFSRSSGKDDGLRLEVRWFYREEEIPARKRGGKGSTGATSFEEIYESDHYEDVSPSSLLGPIGLYDGTTSPTVAARRSGVTIQNFFCCRFWSTAARRARRASRPRAAD